MRGRIKITLEQLRIAAKVRFVTLLCLGKCARADRVIEIPFISIAGSWSAHEATLELLARVVSAVENFY